MEQLPQINSLIGTYLTTKLVCVPVAKILNMQHCWLCSLLKDKIFDKALKFWLFKMLNIMMMPVLLVIAFLRRCKLLSVFVHIYWLRKQKLHSIFYSLDTELVMKLVPMGHCPIFYVHFLYGPRKTCTSTSVCLGIKNE